MAVINYKFAPSETIIFFFRLIAIVLLCYIPVVFCPDYV